MCLAILGRYAFKGLTVFTINNRDDDKPETHKIIALLLLTLIKEIRQ